MPTGGARARSGPPPDPNALRRERDAGEWVTLPAGKRAESAPAWPLEGLSVREEFFWVGLWEKPQALMWTRNEQAYEVALLARNLANVEKTDSPINLGTLVRQQMDSLGLTTPGLRANRWRISRDEVAERRADRTAPAAPARSSSRHRLASVDGTTA